MVGSRIYLKTLKKEIGARGDWCFLSHLHLLSLKGREKHIDRVGDEDKGWKRSVLQWILKEKWMSLWVWWRGRKPRERGKRNGKLGGGGVFLFQVEPLPFLFFSMTFATLEHGLLRLSIIEAQKSCSTLDGGMLKHKALRLSVAYDQ